MVRKERKMKTMIPVLSALLIGLSALSAPANAQQTICGERGDVASKLEHI